MTFKIVFAGTPVFACNILEALLKSSHTVLAVYTQPDKPAGRGRKPLASPTKMLGLAHNLPVFEPSRLNDPAVIAELKSLNPDLMVVAAYGLILPEKILSIPSKGCINVHASILPHFRGAAPIQYAILSGETETGITIMQMDKGMDTGDILSIYPCPILEHDTTQSLQNRLAELGGSALIETLDELAKGTNTIHAQKQDNAKASYAQKITKAEAKLNFNEPAVVLDRKIRAFNPWPIAITKLNGQMIRIWEAEVIALEKGSLTSGLPHDILSLKLLPGMIIKTDKEGIYVATGERGEGGVLKLKTLQFEGGKPLPVGSILNARAALFEVGKQFDSFLNNDNHE